MLAKRRVQVFLEDADWDYLGQLTNVLNTSRSALMREMIEQFVGFLRKSLGNDLKSDKLDVTNFMRVMMVETASAMNEVSNLPESLFERDKKVIKSDE